MNPTAANARDTGLRLISKLNRWMIAGAVALAGVISIVAEKSFHGRTAAVASSTESSRSSSSSGSSSSSTGGSLQQPAQPPSSAPVAPASSPVVSGGS
ncbi:MAG: hypothetical protein ACXVHB_31100 [Solirubrobacteraceae bacterium]